MIPLWIVKCVYAERRKLLLPFVAFPTLGLFSPGQPLRTLCGQRKNEICQGWDSCGLTEASALHSSWIRSVRQSAENLSGGEIGQDLPLTSVVPAWPEVF